jgi:peptidoglycan hydrolase-like protein with peptidoglycan-binding domain
MIDYPKIPERIIVHLGAPESDAENVTETFADYIKNVASSEIYPTWPREAIKANVLAQISVALNRVYTEFYRSSGKDFDITSSPAYDQTYIFQRTIYSTISDIVDDIFNSYIRRRGNIEPLFATFCDGVEVSCNGLSQWGSVSLANDGLSAYDILRNYYGDDIEIIDNVEVADIPQSAPEVPLSEGDAGRDVELMQIRLNRISGNFPGIPKIYPTDGFFDKSTTDAVKKFQEVFGLTPDGIIGHGTWYRIQTIYNAVKRFQSVNSEGLKINEASTQFTSEFKEGDASGGVITLQYYLDYISEFVPTVQSVAVDGVFGPNTTSSVISFQKTYGLSETGIVDRALWEQIQNIYYSFIASVPFEFSEGVLLPFPGRVLRVGIEGEDVVALQSYLNFIAKTYTEIPTVTVDGVYGEATADAVEEFKRIFDIPGDPGRVSVQTWNAVTDVYDDLYNGSIAREGQYPGYVIGG